MPAGPGRLHYLVRLLNYYEYAEPTSGDAMSAAMDAVNSVFHDFPLQVYLLGTVDFDAIIRFQRRLHYEASGDSNGAALILCEHQPFLSVGRHGSRAHIRFEPHELAVRGWPIRWVHRGGGAWLHLPGQLAMYAVFPLERLGLSLTGYLQRLGNVVRLLLADFDLRGETCAGGVLVNARPVATIGVAVHDWVTSFGLCLNTHPSLDLYRIIQCLPGRDGTMTSIERERRGRVKPALIRERVIEHFQAVFGFGRTALFSDHPALHGYMERCPAAKRNVYA